MEEEEERGRRGRRRRGRGRGGRGGYRVPARRASSRAVLPGPIVIRYLNTGHRIAHAWPGNVLPQSSTTLTRAPTWYTHARL